MDTTEVLSILTGLEDTGAIAEVHFDMSELTERAQAIAQAHEQEVTGLLSEVKALRQEWDTAEAQVAVMAEALQEVEYIPSECGGDLYCPWCGQEDFWEPPHLSDCKRQTALSAAPKVLFHETGQWYEDGTLIAKGLKANTMLYTSQESQQVNVIVTECSVVAEHGQNSEQSSLVDSFAELSRLIGKSVENIDDVVAWVREIRGSEQEEE